MFEVGFLLPPFDCETHLDNGIVSPRLACDVDGLPTTCSCV